MNGLDSFIDGMLNAFGMWLMMTVMGLLTWILLKNRITRWAAKVWAEIKREGLKFDGIIVDTKIQTKKLFKKKR